MVGVFAATWPKQGRAESTAQFESEPAVRELYVRGWDSRAAVAETEERLTNVPGVLFARGDFRAGKVTVQFREAPADETALLRAVDAAGYEVVGVGVLE